MQKNLTIDRGNTTTKVVVWEGRRAIYRNTYPRFSCVEASSLRDRYMPGNVMLCSVAGDDEEVMAMLSDVFAGTRVGLLTSETPLPIAVDYQTPATLGSDRIAAAVGGWTLHHGHDMLIVDVGTAVTYDVVTADGHFVGGNIAPGVGMRLKALHQFTARLPLVESKGETPAFGVTTETALRSGAVNGVIAEILFYHSRLQPGAKLILTGGWGSDMAEMLPVKATVKPCLVSIGLNSILTYNETK